MTIHLLPHLQKLQILDRDTATAVRFVPNEPQLRYIANSQEQLDGRGYVRSIILKARQMGFSTATQAKKFTMCMAMDNYLGYTLAHENKASAGLLRMSHRYNESFPWAPFYKITSDANDALAWNHGSRMEIATAGNRATGRGRTIHFLHASEVAFWPDATTLMTGLRQAVPTARNTFIVLESTANGIGNYFHQTWEAAVAGDNEYVPLFYPWYAYPGYRASLLPGHLYVPLGNLDAEEKALVAAGVDEDQLAWRRWALRNLADNDVRSFMQEYPATADEAFLSTGTNVFPIESLRACYEPMVGKIGRLIEVGAQVKFIEDATGPLRIFALPSTDPDWGQYQIGADSTRIVFGDFAVAQVISRRTLEQVAIFRRRLDPHSFGVECDLLGRFYNTATIAPEKEGPGMMVIGTLLGRHYPKLWMHERMDSVKGKVDDKWGWSTNSQTKHTMVGTLKKYVLESQETQARNPVARLVIHDAHTFREMKNYVVLDNGTRGSYGNADGEAHDDTVSGLAIAVVTHHIDLPELVPYGLSSSPEFQSNVLPWETLNDMANPTDDYGNVATG